MKTLVAILLGILAGFLLYMTAAMVLTDPETGPSGAFVAVFFVGGWIGAAYLLRRNARTVSKVVARGALLGAAQWLVVIPIGAIMGGQAASSATGASEAEMAGAAIGGGLITIMTGAVAVGMAVVCLIVFAVAHFMGREMAAERAAPTKKCPECAEMVQAEARKCRFCGASFVTAPVRGTE